MRQILHGAAVDGGGDLLGLGLVFFLAVFLGAAFWAFAGRRTTEFQAAAMLPFDEE
jgi:cbb3-type cytochrome oxidase subunit 3